MPSAKVFLLENERGSAQSFEAPLKKRGYDVVVKHNAREAIHSVADNEPDIVVFDAASLKTSGDRICRKLRDSLNGTPILLVVDRKLMPSPNCGASLTLMTPFTPRKLVNSVARLLPAEGTFALEVGHIKLNLAQKRIVCDDREEKVTPKQAKLLEMFLRAPGKLLTRKEIIKYVWETDYTGDTRTLDVHISWLRGVIEEDPRKPKYLRTIRGEGYRLEIHPN